MECSRTPTKAGFVASGYGPRPGRRTGDTRFHAGLDFRAPSGTPVFSPVAGIIESRIYDDGRVETTVPRGVTARGFRGYGNVLVVKYPGPVWVSFNHLRSFAENTVPGTEINRGHWLGLVGNTSNGRFRGMGAHLHIETRHAPRDGRLSPFPGAYGRENFNPIEWFNRNGMELQGRILRQEQSCGVLAGFGAVMKQSTVPWKSIADRGGKPPAGTEYEPPRSMDSPKSVIALTIAAGVGIVALAALIARKSRGGLSGDYSILTDRNVENVYRSIATERHEMTISQLAKVYEYTRNTISASTKSLELKQGPNCDLAHSLIEKAYMVLGTIPLRDLNQNQSVIYRQLQRKADDAVELINFYCEIGTGIPQ